jgi:hypothetical protein
MFCHNFLPFPLYPCYLSCMSHSSVISDTIIFLLVFQPLEQHFGLNGHHLWILIKSVRLELVDVDDNWVWLKMGHCNQQSCVVGYPILNFVGPEPFALELPYMLLPALRVPEDIVIQLTILWPIVLLSSQGSAPLPFFYHFLGMVPSTVHLFQVFQTGSQYTHWTKI